MGSAQNDFLIIEPRNMASSFSGGHALKSPEPEPPEKGPQETKPQGLDAGRDAFSRMIYRFNSRGLLQAVADNGHGETGVLKSVSVI